MNIKAIIFDFDGVIVESVDIKANAFRHLFKDRVEHVDRIVAWHLLHGGMSRFEKFEYIYKNFLKEELTGKKKEELGKAFAGYVYNEVVKCPFVKGAKSFLKEHHRRYKLFIVSGTPDEEIKAIVKERNLDKYFVEVLGSPKKKDFLIRDILKNFKFRKKDIIFIGDSIDDYNAAKKAGIKFVARVIDKRRPFVKPGKNILVTDICGFEKVLNEI